MSDVTMHELEAETAELLPARETLCSYKGHTSSTSIDSGNGNHDGNGNGNGNWALINVSGNGNGDFDGDTTVVPLF